jgi:hypothetical protein
MNAKLIITVPIDKIPKEITRLLEDICVELNDIYSITKQNVGNKNYLEVLQQIDEVRKKLSQVDITLDDCSNILAGYIKYLSDKNSNQNTQENNHASESQNNESINDR